MWNGFSSVELSAWLQKKVNAYPSFHVIVLFKTLPVLINLSCKYEFSTKWGFFLYVSEIETFAGSKLFYKQHMNDVAVHSRLWLLLDGYFCNLFATSNAVVEDWSDISLLEKSSNTPVLQ